MPTVRRPYHPLWLLCVLATAFALAGCQKPWQLYDPDALAEADKLLVMPAAGAPGPHGPNAGPVETGLLITAIDQLGRFDVEGPGRMRAAFKSLDTGPAVWSPNAQSDLTGQLDADLLVIAEVFDFRPLVVQRHSDYYFGERNWTESNFIVGVTVRIVDPAQGRLIYRGNGSAKSETGYGQAMTQATNLALEGIRQFIADNPVRKTPPAQEAAP